MHEERGVSAYNHRSFLFLASARFMSGNDDKIESADDADTDDESDGDDESPHTLDVLRTIKMTAEIVMLAARLIGVR
ncbi:hypothetical protein C471_09270 [Halorubrum saccharovorum DSM 1137]|uniref:Uncharacterized protein n=2 Tax=Halorubrum saccharovorum TaxID=2248 RepID=M0DXD5_9EURY|nr:hypothetical protein C471_09270 [Halorubrum saccharovorum DSM 1137]